jgi:hypothetical protein
MFEAFPGQGNATPMPDRSGQPTNAIGRSRAMMFGFGLSEVR